ncbi:hypothetical protein ACH46N_18240 [Streptomyces pristinaespiralis]|jgi:hypothetical protein|uniref:Uncharacterized protein n=2 Tax=Streptomyces pristinaespiralis TaxID=38300 RepID=B5HK69_STRE2|nr:hypothetical protein [Streptomyces pristinaespiralis]ALC20740.1 hypothetical protein SPRI_2434 [Streptomyces pristinaespiralis]EDY67230.1 conserved hypothetical protein [Streptomyces pristinaespiralis ATCC 25486]
MRMAFAEDSWYGPQGYESRVDLTTVSRSNLRWYCFLGAWRIEHGTTDISPPWGWTPLFDAFYSVREVMGSAREGAEHDWIDFTENDEKIRIVRRGDDMVLSPTYAEAEIVCSVDEFVDAGRDFIRRELAVVVADHPALAMNPTARQLADEVGLALGP